MLCRAFNILTTQTFAVSTPTRFISQARAQLIICHQVILARADLHLLEILEHFPFVARPWSKAPMSRIARTCVPGNCLISASDIDVIYLFPPEMTRVGTVGPRCPSVWCCKARAFSFLPRWKQQSPIIPVLPLGSMRIEGCNTADRLSRNL